MSRAYDAKRKARRQQARADAESSEGRRLGRSWWRWTALLPVAGIAAILAATALVGFGGESAESREQVTQNVTDLLAGTPQEGTTLGAPEAPISVTIYADLECPTVKRFAEAYLPSIIDNFVRPGVLSLTYRSLQTDTVKEPTFFRQETSALAAGRQDKLWNFVLTFLYEQGEEGTGYATDEFLTGLARQVPELNLARWDKDRVDPALSEQVALGVRSAHSRDLRFTPSFVIGVSEASGQADTAEAKSTRRAVESSLRNDLEYLREEAVGDVPTLASDER